MAVAPTTTENHPDLHLPQPSADKPGLMRPRQPALQQNETKHQNEMSGDAIVNSASDKKASDKKASDKKASDKKASDEDGADCSVCTQAGGHTTRDLEEKAEVSCDRSAVQIDNRVCSAPQIGLSASPSEDEAFEYDEFLDEDDEEVKQVKLLEADSFSSHASDYWPRPVNSEDEDIQGLGEDRSDGKDSEEDEQDRKWREEELEEEIEGLSMLHERLLGDGGRPLFPISQFHAINAKPDAYRDLLLPWQNEYWRPCGEAEWMHILGEQLSNWQMFRNWQRVNRASEDETPPTAQEERLMTLYREVWGMDFAVYVENVRQRLARHGCVLQSLDLRETLDDQDALATWIEYTCFACRSSESARRSVMLQKSKQRRELQLIAEPHANGWAGRVLKRTQKDALEKSGCVMMYSSVDEHDIRHAERRHESKLRIQKWAISQIPLVAAELGRLSPLVESAELSVELEDSVKMHSATSPSLKRHADEINGGSYDDQDIHSPAKSARRDSGVASERGADLQGRPKPVRFDEDVAIFELDYGLSETEDESFPDELTQNEAPTT